MKGYYTELKDKIEFKKDVKLSSFPRRFNQALSSVEREGGYREKTIMESIGSIEINEHGNGIITADIYNTEGDGFQCIVDHIPTEGRPHYKPGDITG